MQHKIKRLTPTWLRVLCLTMLVGLTSIGAYAQTVVIGAGALTSGTGSNAGPIYRSSAGSAFDFSQQYYLYTQAELATAGIFPGSVITQIAWNKGNALGTVATNTSSIWRVYMKNSTTAPGAGWSNSSFTTQNAGATLVYENLAQVIPLVAGYIPLTLNTPFVYTGGSLEIGSSWDCSLFAGSPTTGGFTWKQDALSNQVFGGSASSAAISMFLQTNRPQIQITYTAPAACSGTPTPGNTTVSNATPCPADVVTVGIQNYPGTGATYQWYDNGGAIAGATNPTYSTTVTSPNSFYCDVTCSGNTGSSSIASVTPNAFFNCYCASAATSTADEDISNVTFGSLNNTSTCTTLAPGPGSVASMYSNYKSGAGAPAPVPVTQGQTIPFSLTQTSCGGAFSNKFAIFIDYNQNGSFADAGETVFAQATAVTGNHTQTGTVTIPFTATAGQTAMRVVNVETTGTVSPCGTYTWGETEDYLVDIIAAVPCSGTPAPGNTIASTTLACPNSTVNFSLQNYTNGVDITYQWFNNSGAIAGATNSFYSQVMTTADDVYCDVTCPTATPSTGSSSLVSVTLDSYLNCYCPASSAFGSSGNFYGVVSNVSMASIANASAFPAAAPYYTNYPAGPGTTTNVLPGNLYPLSISVGQYTQVGVWFDWDQSGTFDASEFTFLGNNAVASPITYSANITVPSGATVGLTKMRVRSEAYFYANLLGTQSCGNLNYGETEDYFITVDALVPCSGTPAPGNTLASNSTPCPGTNVTFTLQNNVAGTGVSYQWYNNSGAVAGATNSFYTQLITAADDVYCEVTCSGGGTASSSLLSVTLAPFMSCYCASNATSTADEEIWNVTFGSLNNSSNCTTSQLAPGPGSVASQYANYMSGTGAPVPPAVVTGALVPFSLTQTSCGGAYGNKFAIFIDWNQNGLFTDAGENVYQQATSVTGNHTVTGNITVPVSATLGITAMRVINVETGGTIAPCGTYTWGETEDYLIQVDPATNCSGTPNPGNTLSNLASVCPGGTVNLSLQNNVSATGITFQWNDNSGPIAGATNPFYTATITAPNSFYCDVTCSFSSQTGSSSILSIGVNPFLNCYCASAATTTADEEIYSVTVNGSSTPAAYAGVNGCTTPAPGAGSILSRYSNFTSLGIFANMQEGAPVTFTVEENECDGATFYPFGTAIYIDYNHNGSFADAGELAFVETATATGPRNVVGTFTVPFGVVLGQTGMRVIVAEGFAGASFNPCLSYGFGETEDFIVDITASVSCTGTPVPGNTIASASSVCPNGTVTLSLQNQATLGGGNTYQWYNNSGAVAGATNPTYTATITAADNFYCDVTCTNSAQMGTSTPVAVGVNPFFSCYCIPTNAGSACITNVAFGTLSNTTAGCPGGTNYNSFPTPNPVVFQGNTETLSVTCDGGAITSVWIDYDHSGTYDVSEWNQVYTNALTGSISITIPFTSMTGLTGMRVRSRLTGNVNGATDACLAMGSGETEDFVIDIQVPFACSGTPTPGNTVASASSACPNTSVSLSLSGQATIGSGATYQWYNNGGLIAGATNPTYSQVMTAPDAFYCDVTCTNSSLTASSGIVSVGINGFINCYCSTGLGGSCGINAMSSVDITGTTLNNVTGGCTGTYNAFPASGSTTASLVGGTTYTMNVGVIAGSNTQVAVWIDYDQNGTFDASEYTLINSSIPSGASGSGTFTIPITALGGNTGMRVRSDWEGAAPWTSADACTNRIWGETEDYIITIVPPVACTGTPAPGNTIATPSAVCPGQNVTVSLQNMATLGSGVTFQWYNNAGIIAGATDAFYTFAASGPDSYYCDVTCTNSSLTGSSSIASITINNFFACYCASVPSQAFDEEIYSVTVNGGSTDPLYAGTNGCTTAAPGPGSILGRYSNFTTLPAITSVMQGSSVAFSVVEDECDGPTYYAFGTGIWIDFNHNGSFSDPGEDVFIESATATGPRTVTGTLAIPITALTGPTGMRVIVAEGISGPGLIPCLQYGYGETEDFVIDITASTACTGTPTPGNTIASVNPVCPNGTTVLSVQNATTGTGVTYQWYNGAGAIAGATDATYTATITAADNFYCDVTCSSGPSTGSSTPVAITLNSLLNCYCAAGATNGCTFGDEYVGNVTVGTINNTTACATTYSNFTSISTNMTQGAGYPASVLIPNWFSGDQATIWIDFNQDGDLTDPGEQFDLLGGGTGPTDPFTGTINVPLTALTGTTLMRVRGAYIGLMDPCGNATYGEVEDYAVVIDPAPTNTTLNLTCFIQSYWDGASAMRPALFNQGQSNPTTDCDSITVMLMDATTYAMAYSTVAVLQTNGTASCVFSSSVSGSYYIAVTHRNALETWSDLPVTFAGPTASYNFSTASTQAYGGNQIEVATGIWAFYSGDVIKDAGQSIDLLDLGQIELEINNFSFGYFAEDVNGDGNVDILDTPEVEPNVSNFVFSQHP